MEQEGQHIALDVISSTSSVPGGGGGDNTPAEKETTLAMYTQVFLTLATKTFGPNAPTTSNSSKAYKVYSVFSLLVFTFDFLFVLYFVAPVAGVRVPPIKKMKAWIYSAVAISFFTFVFGTSLLLVAA